MTRETIKEYILQVKSQDGTEALYNRWEPDILVEVINEIFNDHEEQLKAKDEKLQQLDDAYASVVSDFESAVMELAKKDKEIEKLKKQYHQCLDDYIKCAERKEQQ